MALTKADLVEAEWLEMVQADVTEFLKGTFLEGCPIVPCSGTTGQGLPALLAAIQTQAAAAEPKRTQGILRLPGGSRLQHQGVRDGGDRHAVEPAASRSGMR